MNLISYIVPRSLHWRIAIAYTSIIVLIMVLLSYFMSGYIKGIIKQHSVRHMEEQSRLIADLLSHTNLQGLSSEEKYDHRIVVFDQNELVLLDTKYSDLEFIDQPDAGELYSESLIIHNGQRYGKVRVYSNNGKLENQIESVVLRALLIGLAVASVAVILSVYLARRTNRSIKVLTSGATKIESGDLTYRVRVSQHEETAELADAFNLMADTISEMVENISKFDFDYNDVKVRMTISAGMAEFPADTDKIESLIDKADKAMYETKSIGGDGVTITSDA